VFSTLGVRVQVDPPVLRGVAPSLSRGTRAGCSGPLLRELPDASRRPARPHGLPALAACRRTLPTGTPQRTLVRFIRFVTLSGGTSTGTSRGSCWAVRPVIPTRYLAGLLPAAGRCVVRASSSSERDTHHETKER